MTFHLVNSSSFAEKRSILEDFGQGLYQKAFPDPDEREPFEKILARVETARPDEPVTIAVIAEESGRTVAGLVTDWYPVCNSLEVIYIAVDPAARRSGLGKEILMEGTRTILDSLSGEDRRINVFFETENPMAVNAVDSPIDPVGRLSFFNKCGAKRVPIDYVQPPLDDSTGWDSNMFLMMLPELSYAKESITIDELSAFLHEFYKGLGALGTKEYDELIRNVVEVADAKGDIWLDRIMEEPQFRIGRAAVATHFIASDPKDAEGLLDTDRFCPVFNSYECDLMNYSHQEMKKRPFTTHHRVLIEDATLVLPSFYSYSSEGHSFYRLSSRREIKADISINWSVSRSSHDTMAHVVIAPSEGEYFSELELIKIITEFGSRQEAPQFIEGRRIVAGGREYSSFKELLCGELAPANYTQTHTGVSEIELSGLTDNDGNVLFRNFDEFRLSISETDSPEDTAWNKAVCGLVLGIFDFERMNAPEIYDTIQPIVKRRNTFHILCRGHLVKFCHENEEDYERVENILISPYLLIPSTALAYNELTLERNWQKIGGQFQKRKGLKRLVSWTFSEKVFNYSELLTDTENSLSSDYMKDIFQYPSEREILQVGQMQRGLDTSLADLQQIIDIKENELDDMKSKYQGSIDTLQNILLMILAIMQVYTAINNYHKLFFAIVILTIIIGLLIFIRKRRL